MNEYEMLYILHPRLSVDEVTASSEWVNGLVRAQGGEIRSVDVWGRRRLAYPINHELEGTYVLARFDMPPTGVAPLEHDLVISRDVLRHIVVKGIIGEGGAPEEHRGGGRGRFDDDRRDDDRDDDRRDDRRDDDRRRDDEPRDRESADAAPSAVEDSAPAAEAVESVSPAATAE